MHFQIGDNNVEETEGLRKIRERFSKVLESHNGTRVYYHDDDEENEEEERLNGAVFVVVPHKAMLYHTVVRH